MQVDSHIESEVESLDNDQTERVAILIDGPNFYNMAQNMSVRIDYSRCVRLITLGRKVIVRNIYCQPPLSPGRKSFYKSLKQKHHLCVIECDEGDDVDDLINFDIQYYAQREDIDTIILVAGDGGYLDSLRPAHRQHGKNVEIVSIKKMLKRTYLGNGFKIIELSGIKQFIIEESSKQTKTTRQKSYEKHANKRRRWKSRFSNNKDRKNDYR